MDTKSTQSNINGGNLEKDLTPPVPSSPDKTSSRDALSGHRSKDESPNTGTGDLEAATAVTFEEPPFSTFTRRQCYFIVFMVSWGGLFSSISANIYLPALNTLASHLHVTSELINLTITSYMILQALSPTVFGDFADMAGRRPAYIIAFVIYLGANTGLALQNSYPALLVLRCLQSAGSSGTIALGSGVIADIVPISQRGTYMGAAFVGPLTGPAIGPIIGGILAQFLGWRAIFWFLVISAGTFLAIFAITFPETGRNVVGNGSIPPQGWNMSLLHYLHLRKLSKSEDTLSRTTSKQSRLEKQSALAKKRKLRVPNPLNAIRIIFEKDVGLLLLFNSLVFVVFYDLGATLPSQFKAIYGFNDLQIGLSFIPFGTGCALAALINGRFLDWNYKRIARALNFSVIHQRRSSQALLDFPIERARLQVCVPHLIIGLSTVLCYGWVLHQRAPLAVPLILTFIMGITLTSCTNTMSTILVDLYPMSPATATAANNLVRCLMGAVGTAVVQLMINGMGVGWCFTFLGLLIISVCPVLLVVVRRGPGWRAERLERLKKADQSLG